MIFVNGLKERPIFQNLKKLENECMKYQYIIWQALSKKKINFKILNSNLVRICMKEIEVFNEKEEKFRNFTYQNISN